MADYLESLATVTAAASTLVMSGLMDDDSKAEIRAAIVALGFPDPEGGVSRG